MYLLGITGGIASGKSTVSKYLEQKKVPILDADAICYELSKPNNKIWDAYVKHFGADILDVSGQLNRKKIGAKVFSNEVERQWMNETMHPIIEDEIKKRIGQYEGQYPLVILDIPLLFEAGWHKYCNKVWLVYVSEEEQIKRVVARDKISIAEAKQRIAAQMPLSKKMELADNCISTNKSFQAVEEEVDILWNKLMEEIRG